MQYLYSINLENYQLREIPKEIVTYSQDLKRSLFSSVRRYARIHKLGEYRELHRVEKLLEAGYILIVFRPKTQIKGWIWISPENRIERWYVFENYRDRGWGKKLVYAALNSAEEKLEILVDSQNPAALRTLDSVLEKICCRASITKVE